MCSCVRTSFFVSSRMTNCCRDANTGVTVFLGTKTQDFREKNTDHMRPDIVALLKSSKNAFICGLMGIDPTATFRWAVLRAYFRALVAFREAGRRHRQKKTGELMHLSQFYKDGQWKLCPYPLNLICADVIIGQNGKNGEYVVI